MTTPRPSPTAQLRQEMAAMRQEMQRMADEVAALRSGQETPTRAEFELLARRQDAFDQRLHEDAEHHFEGEAPTDLTPLQDQIQEIRDILAQTATRVDTHPEHAAMQERLTTLERARHEQPQQGEAPPPPPPVDLGPLETRVQAVEDRTARMEALPPPDSRVDGLTERVTALERAGTEQTQADPTADFRRDMLQLVTDLTRATERSRQELAAAQGEMARMVEAVARDVADLRTTADGALAAGLASDALAKVNGKVDAIDTLFNVDATLFTAKTRTGFQVDTPGLADGSVSTAKIADGAVDTTQIADAAVETAKLNDLAVTAGKLAASAVETDKINNLAVTAGKLAASAVETDKLNNGAVTNDKLAASGLDISKMTAGDLTLGAGQDVGFFGATPAGQQTSGANLTNSVTSGGTNDQIDDWAIVDYATDAAAIRNAVYQLGRKLKQINDGARTLGLFT